VSHCGQRGGRDGTVTAIRRTGKKPLGADPARDIVADHALVAQLNEDGSRGQGSA